MVVLFIYFYSNKLANVLYWLIFNDLSVIRKCYYYPSNLLQILSNITKSKYICTYLHQSMQNIYDFNNEEIPRVICFQVINTITDRRETFPLIIYAYYSIYVSRLSRY